MARIRTAVATVALGAAVALLLPTGAAAARHTVRVEHRTTPFRCQSYDFEPLGGGTLTVHQKRTLLETDGDWTSWHVTGSYRFRADNGSRRTYRVDYVSSGVAEATWEGTFVISDTIQWNNWWFADPGEAAFSEGGYINAADPSWSSICTELGYPFVYPPD
jgi:hypothetical protein